MTDEQVALLQRLATVTELAAEGPTHPFYGQGFNIEYRQATAAIRAALEEYAALREIAQAVAGVPDADYREECPFCHESPGYLPIEHTADCPVTKARALLSASGSRVSEQETKE